MLLEKNLLKKFWNKVFYEKKECRNYYKGLCLLKMNNQALYGGLYDNYVCEICSEFRRRKGKG